MESPLERKLQREVAARKQAEQLLEEKSLELYHSNQQLAIALGELEKTSSRQLQALEFQRFIDDLLIHYGRVLLRRDPDELILDELLTQLEANPWIEHLSLTLSSQADIPVSRFSAVLTPVSPGWDDNQLTLTLEQEGSLLAIMEIRTLGELHDEIENGLTKIADLLCSAFQRQMILLRQIELREQAQASERATREFLAMINHELRTPLNGLLGGAELLSETRLDDDQNQLLSTINHSGELLRCIINDLLDFSKLNAGMFELIQRPFRFSELEQTLEGIFASRAQQKGLSFSITSSDTVPACLEGDIERISQILVNLIGNAVKFTEQGFVSVSLDWQHGLFSAKVTDSGIGIRNTRGLFEPFTQEDKGDRRQYEGTGLGLAICKQLIDLMNGEIKVHSQPGKGSNFYISIPLCETQALPPQVSRSAEQATPLSGELSILVVEDIKVNQLVVEQMLNKIGISPVLADNGLQALQSAEKRRYDLILMDCRMPIMDGFEATRRLRDKGYRQPIIALTAGTTADERTACQEAGMDDLLSKPYRSHELVSMIEKWVHHS